MKAGTAKPKPNVYNQPIAMRYIYMSNLTPDQVDVRLTETREEFSEEHTRLWEGLEDEKVSRIAGDEANKQFTQQVQDENQGTESRLSTEVIHRSEGDLSNVNSITALAQALADYRIKTDLELANEALVREQLGIDLNTRMDNVVASFDHEKFLIYKTISEVQTDVNNKYTSMDLRIKKYEEMLQDITTDSIQITMDNGEINMGAWTILSQAREWDLEILAKFKDYKTQTEKDINDALEDLQNKLPVEQDIIDKAIEALSNAPIIKELDEKLTSNIDSIDEVKKDLLQETTDRTNEIIGLAQANANALTKQAKELTDKLELEARERIDSIQKESEIRQQQLLDESNDRTQEIDEKLKDVWINIDEETAERLKQIELLQDGLTQEIQHRKDGDSSITTELNNYKATTNGSLANIQDSITVLTTDTTANATKLTALDGRVTVVEKDTGVALENSALALDKANIAINANEVTANKVTALQADMTAVQGELSTKASAQALQTLETTVTKIDGEVKSQAEQLTQVKTGLDTTNKNVTANAEAISGLKTTTSQTASKLETVASDVTVIKADLNTVKGEVNNKADAKAVQDLTVRVTDTEKELVSVGTKITSIDNSVAQIKKDVASKADASYVQTIDNKVGVIEGKVTSNTADIVTIKNSVSQIEKDVALKADAKALETLSNQVTINKNDIKSNSAKLVSLDNSITQVTNATFINGGSSLTEDIEFNRPALTKGDVAYQDSAEASNTRFIKLGSMTVGAPVWMHAKRMLQFDPNRMYRVKCRFCVTEVPAGLLTPIVYIGFAAKNADMTSYIDTTGKVSPNMGSSSYLFTITPSIGVWYERTYYVSGRSLGASTGNGSLDSPKTVQANAAYIAPLFITSYPSRNGITLLDYLYMEVADEAKVLDANAKAIESLTSDVSTVKGDVTSLSNKTTLLENRVTTTENGLAKKADAAALQALDSRVVTAEGKITSQGSSITKLENSVDSLTVGGVNQLLNSGPERSSAASTNREYLMYERSEYLKGFLDENLGKPVTISFEVKMPVTGQLQIYASNQSYHAYAANVQVTAVNTWIKYSVTVIPAKNTGATDPTRSTLEFYGVAYGSGRIPTLRNVQMEAGSIATPWRASFRDAEANFKANASAIETLDNKVTTVDGKVTVANNKITALEGRVQTTEDGLKKKADVTALEGLQTEAQVNSAIASKLTQLTASLYSGTDNLLLDSSLETLTGWGSNNGTVTLHTRAANPSFVFPNTNKQTACWKLVSTAPNQGRYRSPQGISFELNEDLVGSIWLKGEVGGEKIAIMTEGIKYETPGLNGFTLTTEWKRYWVTGRRAAKGSFNFTIYSNNPAGTTQTVYLSQVQLERGNIPSDWKEASTTTTGLMNATATTLAETKAMVTEHDGKITTNTSDLTNLKGRMEVAESGIVAQTEATRLLTGRVEKTEKGVDANTKALTQVNTTISQLEVGGTNTFSSKTTFGPTNVNAIVRNPPEAPRGFSFGTVNANPKVLRIYNVVTGNGFWTVSGRIRGNQNVSIGIRIDICDQNSTLVTTTADNTFTYFKVTAEVKNWSAAVYNFVDLEPQGWANYIIDDLKVEKGNFATAWSPAPEDVASANALSLLDTRVVKTEEGIKTTADALTKVETKVALTKKYIVSTFRGGTTSGPAAGLMDETGDTRLATLYRGLNLIVFEADGSFKSSTGYDTYATLANAQTLATAINALPSKTYFIVAGLDNVGSLSASGTNVSVIALKDAIVASGGSEAYFNTWTGNSMPIFVGRRGAGSGMGIQNLFNSNVGSDWIRIPIVFQAGTPEGFGGTPVIDTTQFASATALNNLSTKVSAIDGKVLTQAESITQLEANVGANSAKLLVQGTAIDGLSASYVVKTDVNGLVVSYGLYNKDGVGAFGVNADYFYVGKGTTATNGKKPFMVLTSAQTIGGVTYPAGTWIDVALIANATIGTAKIADLAVTNAKIANLAVDNAKIANLSAEKITAGTINAARIGAKSITADKLYSDTVSGMFANFGTFTTVETGKGKTVISGSKIEVYDTNNIRRVFIGIE